MKTLFKLSLLAALLLNAGKSFATNEVLTVAVYDFSDADRGAVSFGSKVTTLVTADLTTETNLVMLERADLTKVLNEQAFSISGMVSADAAAKIGQITGVKVLVAGQVIKSGDNRLIVIANIIGTETGRLFATKVEGAADNLLALTTGLSSNIARTISMQATNLVAPAVESHDERVARMVKNLKGKNRPSVSISLTGYNMLGQNWGDEIVKNEIGGILLKAGFTVVDEASDQKPDVQITGSVASETGMPRGGLLTGRSTIELKIQERRTGNIIGLDHQEATASDLGVALASKSSQIKAVVELAERILPLLAQDSKLNK